MKTKKIITAISCLALVTGTFAATEGWYRIAPKVRTAGSFDLPGVNGSSGKLTLYASDGGTDQMWYLKDVGSWKYELIPRSAMGKRLDVPFANDINGNQLQIWDCNNSDAQRFYLWDFGNGFWEIKSAIGTQRALDLDACNAANDTRIQLWDKYANDCQKWQFNNVSVASVYQDCAFGGKRVELVPGNYTMTDLGQIGAGNDWISSLRVNGGYKVTAYWDDNFTGASYTWTGDDDCIVNEGWNDKITSLKIELVGAGGAPGYAGYTLWSNENFDNGWDGSKWATGCGTFGENATRFNPSAVYTSGGLLHLKIWKEDNWGWNGCENAGQQRGYYGGEFRMINPSVTYGIAEARIHTPGNGGYIASLFTYDYGAATNRFDGWNEIDIELEGRTTDKVSTNLLEGNCSHSWECTQWCYCACSQLNSPWAGFSHAGQWHDYRIEFTPSYIKWFVDGSCIRTIDGGYIYRNPNGEDVRYASATNGCSNGWRDGYLPGHSTRVMANMWLAQHGSVANALGGEWSDNQLPKECLYDWIRVYTRN
jgi:hypothetical protein